MPDQIGLAEFCRRRRILGCTSEIDYRTRVGTPAWQANHPPRIRKLSALRRAHMIADHAEVRRQLRRMGGTKANDLAPREWVQIVRELEQNKTREQQRVFPSPFTFPERIAAAPSVV